MRDVVVDLQRAARAAALDVERTETERTIHLPPWNLKPDAGQPFNVRGSFAAPAFGVANEIIVASYTVPAGFTAILAAVMNQFIGVGFVQGSGDIVFSVDVNRPLTATSGYTIPDFASIITDLGSLTGGPWPIPGGFHYLKGEDVLRYKCRTVGTVGTGAPNFVHAALLGWIWPGKGWY